MLKNDISEQVRLIENLELKLTEFNSQRALAKIEKHLEVREIGKCKLLIDTTSPQSAYYNRIKGFSSDGLPDLEKILNVYQQLSIAPCFDMTPNNVTDLVAVELHRHGFYDSDQLVFMNLRPEQRDQPTGAIKIVDVTQTNAAYFIDIIEQSQNRSGLERDVIESKKHYFYEPNFHNYICYIGDDVAGIGSLFMDGEMGYIANDFTFERFRGRGVQKDLLRHRINEAIRYGLKVLCTDVEFASISHNNMAKAGFKTVFINSFWTKCTVD